MALLTVGGKVLLADGKPVNAPSGGATQEKTVNITANGTTEITPDIGKTLSKVTAIVDVLQTGGGGSDISLGLTGAAVGQIAKISAVDENGKPTAWIPVDMLSGGGDWELLAEQTVEEEILYIEVSVEKPYKNILIIDDMPQASTTGVLTVHFNGTVVFSGANFLTDSTLVYTRKRAYVFDCAEPYVLAITSNGSANQIGGTTPVFSYKPYNGGPVTSIRYGGITNNRLLPAGTSVKFYGR